MASQIWRAGQMELMYRTCESCYLRRNRRGAGERGVSPRCIRERAL